MIIYLPCVVALFTYYIFQSKGIDYRAVGIGALLPFTIDQIIGHASFGHSFLFPVATLIVIMLGTIGQPRLRRRRLLCIVIGIFFALVLEGTFIHETMWWWPINADSAKDITLTPRLIVWIIRDIIGLIALYILIGIGDLYKKEKLQAFFKTGRINS